MVAVHWEEGLQVAEGQPSYKSEAVPLQEGQAEARSRVHPAEADRDKDRPDKGRDKDTPDSPEDNNSVQVAWHLHWHWAEAQTPEVQIGVVQLAMPVEQRDKGKNRVQPDMRDKARNLKEALLPDNWGNPDNQRRLASVRVSLGSRDKATVDNPVKQLDRDNQDSQGSWDKQN